MTQISAYMTKWNPDAFFFFLFLILKCFSVTNITISYADAMITFLRTVSPFPSAHCLSPFLIDCGAVYESVYEPLNTFVVSGEPFFAGFTLFTLVDVFR